MTCPNCDADVDISNYPEIRTMIIQCTECDYEETRDTDYKYRERKKHKTVKFTVVAPATPEMKERIKSYSK